MIPDIIEQILRERQKRAEHVHETVLLAREAIRTHLVPDSPSWLRDAFDKLHAAHHVLGGDPFDMHIRAALAASPSREALEIAEAVARSVVERGASPGDENARQLQQIATRALASPSREPDSGAYDRGRRDWVDCPICGEPDMRREIDEDGHSIIFCVNHGCRSNNVATPPASASPAEGGENG